MTIRGGASVGSCTGGRSELNIGIYDIPLLLVATILASRFDRRLGQAMSRKREEERDGSLGDRPRNTNLL